MSDSAAQAEPRRKNVRYNRSLTPAKFWQRIQKPVGCWLYDGAKETNGYGYLQSPLPDGPRFITAHKLAWILTNGPVPEGLHVLHKCDIRACCNPDHLYLGTDADNMADKVSRKRNYIGEDLHTAKLTEVQAREIIAITDRRKGQAIKVAKRYGVKNGTISTIWRGDSWMHLPRP